MPTLLQIFWGPLANGARWLARWRRQGLLGKALGKARRRGAFRLEQLEPRILLSADLAYSAGSGALDATLRFIDEGATLQLIDNQSLSELTRAAVSGFEPLEVSIAGGSADDTLIIDFSTFDAASPVDIAVDFAGGSDLLVLTGGDFDEVVHRAVGADAGSVGLGSASLPPRAVAYTGVEGVIDLTDASDRIFANESGVQQQIRLSDDGLINGLYVIDSNETDGFAPILLGEPTAAWIIRAGGQGDTLILGELEPEFVASVTLEGGAGADTLIGPASNTVWTIGGTGAGELTDQESSETLAQFVGIENLTGAEDTEDSFIVEAAGSLSGLVDGGAGGFDELIIHGAATVLVVPDASGSASFEDRAFLYAGLEPLVDASDPNTVAINATLLSDDLILEAVAGDPMSTQVRSLDYSFLTGAGVVSALQFANPVTSLTVNLRADDDALTLGTLDAGFGASIVVVGSQGIDELTGLDAPNEWAINAPNAGSLNVTTSFMSVENVTGGAQTDLFTLTVDGSLSGTVAGGAGADELAGPARATAWFVTGADAGELTDQESGDTLTQFAGIENLTGVEDTEDSFIVEASGSVSGVVNGGDGGFDELLIRSATGAAVLVVPDATGSAMFDGRTTVLYSGLESFVDTSNPAAVAINATVLSDDLILEAVAGDPVSTQVRSLGYGFLTGAGVVSALQFANPATSLTVNLRAGDDAFALGTLDAEVGASIVVVGSQGTDELTGPDALNEWEINTPDAGSLNDALEFIGFEDLTGGALADVFTLGIDGSLSGTVAGGAGTDELVGPVRATAWFVTGADAGELTDQESGERLAQFVGIENLTGAEDTDDGFRFEMGGSLSGFVDGGGGGADSLVVPIRGTFLFLIDHTFDAEVSPDAGGAGSVTIANGTSVTYRGIDPFVNNGVVSGTVLGDNFVLEADPGNAGHLRLRSADPNLLFWVNNGFSDSLSFLAPRDLLTVNLKFGNDSLTIGTLDPGFTGSLTVNGDYGSDQVTVSANLYLPGSDLEIQAEDIAVNDGVTVSTRQIGGSVDPADHLIAASTGDSGSIVLHAISGGELFQVFNPLDIGPLSETSSITIGSGARLLAHVDAANPNGFAAGDITLVAKDENGLGAAGFLLTASGLLPLQGVFTNSAEVVVLAGAAIQGAGVTLQAKAKFVPQPDLFDHQIFDDPPFGLDPETSLLGGLLAKTPLADFTIGGVVALTPSVTSFISEKVAAKLTGDKNAFKVPLVILGKIADATVDIGEGVRIFSSDDVALESSAVSDATVKVSSPLFSVGSSVAHATSEVLVGEGVQVEAAGNVSLAANAVSIAKVDASTKINGSPSGKVNLARSTGSLAITESQTTAHAIVADGASIEAGGTINVAANGVSKNEGASKIEIFLDGKAGISAAVGVAHSDIKAEINGSLVAQALDSGSALQAVDSGANTIDLGPGAGGLSTGEGLVYEQGGTTEVNGLEDGKTYYAISTDDPAKLKLAASRSDALQGKAINLSVGGATGDLSLNTLARAQSGIAVTADLASSDKAGAESGIGEAAPLSLGQKIGSAAGSTPVRWIAEKLPFGLLEKLRGKAELLRIGDQVQLSKPSDYSLAGAVAFSFANHDVSATIGSTGSLKSRSDLLVDARQSQEVQTAAETSIDAEKSVNPGKKGATSIALGIGIFLNDVRATIGDAAVEQVGGNTVEHKAVLDASGAMRIHSEFSSPLLIDFTTLPDVATLGEWLKEKFDLKELLFNSWSRSVANAEELAVAGSINFLDFSNVTEATVGAGALINQDTLYRSDAQSVSVEADAALQLVNMSGVFDLDFDPVSLAKLIAQGDRLGQLLGSEGGQKGFGGSIFVMLLDDRTVARVAGDAMIHTGTGPDGGLTVSADAKLLDIALVQSGGQGGKFGASGSFSLVSDTRSTLAYVEGGAQVTGGGVTVSALDHSTHWNGVGAFIKGEAKGVGVSVAINLVNRDTAAFIGAGADMPPAAEGTNINVTGDLTLEAKATGGLHTLSLAGAFESNKPMAGDPVDPLDGVSLPILFGEMEPLEEPAKTGLGIAGSVSFNTVTDRTRAYINDTGTITADDISLGSDNDTSIISVSGAAAIVKTQGSQKSNALAGAFSFNQLAIETQSFIVGAHLTTLRPAGDDADELTLDADHAGFLFSFSAGGAGAPTKNGTAGAGSVSVNRIVNSTEAILDGVGLTTSGDVGLSAADDSEMVVIAGGGSYGQNKGVGASIALNGIASETRAAILGDHARASLGAEIAPVGSVDLSAISDTTIRSLAISLGASQQTGAAVTLSLNLITKDLFTGTENRTEAVIAKTDLFANGAVTLLARNDSNIEAVAGALGIGGDKLGFGAALGWNQLSGTVSARIENASVTTAGEISLTAESVDTGPEGRIRSAAVGAAGSNATAIGGALSINVVHDTIDAHVSGDSTVSANGKVVLDASDASGIRALTGGVALALGKSGAGAAVGVNDIANTITAHIDSSEVSSTSASVELGALSAATIGAITLGGAGAEKSAGGGSVSINLLHNKIDAHISNSATVTARGRVGIVAADKAGIRGGAGGIAGSTSNAFGAALATNDILDTTTAYIDASTVTSKAAGIDVSATSDASIVAVTVGGSGAQSFALGGSITVNLIKNVTDAHVSGGAELDAFGNVNVSATEARTNEGALDLGYDHSFSTGDAVVYDSGGGADIGGLTSGVTYYVLVDSFDVSRVRLAETRDDALAGIAIAIDPSAASGSDHTLTASVSFDPALAIDDIGSPDTIDLGTDHGLVTGSAVVYRSNGGAEIDGLSDGGLYFAIVDETDPNKVRLADSGIGAFLGLAIDIDPSTATGTDHQLVRTSPSFDPSQDVATTGIVGLAGGVAGAEKNAVGAALATNDIANQVKAYFDDAAATSSTGAVDIEASSDAKVFGLTIGGSGAGSFALGGSVSVNLILNTIDAHVSGQSVLDAHGSVSLMASDRSEIDGWAGGIAFAGKTAIGAALATNDIANAVKSYIDNSSVGSASGGVMLEAASDADVFALTAGGSGAGTFALGGSVAVNVIKNTTDAHITSSSGVDALGNAIGVEALGNVIVIATDSASIDGISGGLAGAGTTAIGAALATNDILNTTTAYVDASRVVSIAGNVQVDASSTAAVRSLTLGGAGAGTFALGGSVSVNIVSNTIDAHVASGSDVDAAGDIGITATDRTEILAGAGGFAGAGSTAIGAALATNDTANSTTAFIAGSTVDSSAGDVRVNADSQVEIFSATVSGGGAGSVNVNGSIAVHVTLNDTAAYIGEGSVVTADGNVLVAASDELSMIVGAGNLGGAGSAAVGISSSTVITSNTTEAYVAAGAEVNARGNRGASAVLTGEKFEDARAVGGLEDGRTYFAIVDDTDPGKIRLAASVEDARLGKAIDLDPAAATGAAHRLGAPATPSGQQIVFDPSTDVDGLAETIVLGSGHDFATGDAVVYGVPKGDKQTESLHGLSVAAVSFEDIITLAVGGQGAGSAGIAGSATVSVLNETTKAHIGHGARINADNAGAGMEQSVAVLASDRSTLFGLGGALAIGGSAGVGAGADVLVLNKDTQAFIAASSTVNAGNNVVVEAVSDEDITSISASIGGGGSAGIGGAASVPVLDITTRAFVGPDQDEFIPELSSGNISFFEGLLLPDFIVRSQGSWSDDGYAAGQAIAVSGSFANDGQYTIDSISPDGSTLTLAPTDDLSLESTSASALQIVEQGSAPGMGASLDAGTISFADNGVDPDTIARTHGSWTGDGFKAGQSITVSGSAQNDGIYRIADISANGLLLTLTPDAELVAEESAVPLLQVTLAPTRVSAGGSVVVSAEDHTEIDLIAGNIAGAGTVSVGASAAVPVVSKTTQAFVGRDAIVNANAGRAAIDVNSGEFMIGFVEDPLEIDVPAPLFVASGDTLDVDLTGDGNGDLDEESLTRQRTATAQTRSMQGVAVTAISQDDIETVGASGGGSGTVAVNIGGSVQVTTNDTSAFIDEGARLNLDGSEAGAEQSVLVAAGSDYFHMGMAVVGAGSGVVAVTPSADVTVVTNTTKAYVEDGAEIRARKDIQVVANAVEDILSISAGVAVGGTVGVAGSVSVISVHSTTHAYIGDDASSDAAGAKASADGNILVAARDDTDVDMIAGSLAVGIGAQAFFIGAGVGASVGVTVVEKDTQAFVGDHASIDAKANAGDLAGIYDGEIGSSGFSTAVDVNGDPSFRGLAIQAASSEDVFSAAVAGAFGTYGGVAGGVLAEVVNSSTIAHIGANANVNTAAGANPLQSVNVSAVNSAAVFSIAGGAGGGIAGIGGGVDGGVLRNDTSAFIDNGAEVHARRDVDVNALSKKRLDSIAISAALGAAAGVGSVSVWAIGERFDSSYTVDGHSQDSLATISEADGNTESPQFADVPSFADAMAGGGDPDNGYRAILDGYAVPQFAPAAVDNAADTIDLGSGHGLSSGDAVVYDNGEGDSIGGLTDGETYYVILDDDPARIQLAASPKDAREGTAIDLDASLATGTAHGLTPFVSGGTSDARNRIDDSAPAGEVSAATSSDVVPKGTTAFIGRDALVSAGNDVNVRAKEEVDILAVTGSVAVGLGAGIGASVTILNLASNTDAHIGGGAFVSAGPGSGNDVLIEAALRADVTGLAFAGQAGTVTLGAQVVVVNDSSTQRAYVEDGAVIARADTVTVAATADRSAHADAVGGGLGGTVIGAAVAVADLEGTTSAFIDGAVLGKASADAPDGVPTVNQLNIVADSTASAAALSIAVAAGLGGGAVSASVAVANVRPEIEAYIGADAHVVANGDVSLDASVDAQSSADALGIGVDALGGLGVSVAVAMLAPNVSAHIGQNATVNAGDDLKLRARSNVGAAGERLDKGARASATSGSGGLVLGGAGAFANASVAPTVETYVDTGSTITAGHDVRLLSQANSVTPTLSIPNPLNSSEQIKLAGAQASGAAFGVIGVGVSVADASIGGSVDSHIGTAAVLAGHDVAIASESYTDAFASAQAVSGGAIGGAGNGATVTVNPIVSTHIGANAEIVALNDVRLTSRSEADGAAEAKGVSVGITASVGVSLASVDVSPSVATYIGAGATVEAGGDVVLRSLHNVNDAGEALDRRADAFATASGGAILAGSGADVDVTAAATVQTYIGDGTAAAEITAGGDVTLQALSHNDATANANGLTIGLVGVGVVLGDAASNGTTEAILSAGTLLTAGANLTLEAGSQNRAIANTVASGGGLLSGQGTHATATASPATSASVGSGARVQAGQDARVLTRATNTATATSGGGSFGGLAVGASLADASIGGSAIAHVDADAMLDAGRDLAVEVDSDDRAMATASATAGGVSGGAGAASDADVSRTVATSIGDRAALDAAQDVGLSARALVRSQATSTGTVASGAVGVGASFAEATGTVDVSASIGESAEIIAGRNLDLEAVYNIDGSGTGLEDTLQADATGSAGSLLVGVLLGAEALVDSEVVVNAAIGPFARLDAGNDMVAVSAAYNSVSVQATGNAGGLFAAGGGSGTRALADIRTTADTAVGTSAQLTAGHDLMVASGAITDVAATSSGASGQDFASAFENLLTTDLAGFFSGNNIPSILSNGGTLTDVTVHNTASTEIHLGGRLEAGNVLSVSAQAETSVDAFATMSGASAFVADAAAVTDVFVDSDALVRLHDGAFLVADVVEISARNQGDAVALADADVTADIARGTVTAISRLELGSASDPSEARVSLGAANITGRDSVVIEALNSQKGNPMLSRALADAFGGITSTASALADGTAQVRSRVESNPGMVLTTPELMVNADSAYVLQRDPQAAADTVVTHLVEQVRTIQREVKRTVCKWFPWPLNLLCNVVVDVVTETIITVVEVADLSSEFRFIRGDGLTAQDTIDLDGDIFNFGAGSKRLIVNADGSIDPASNVSATVQGGDILVDDIVSDGTANIGFVVPKGTVSGAAVLHLSKVIDEVSVVNHSDLNLVFGTVQMVANDASGDLEINPDIDYRSQTEFEYEIDSQIVDSRFEVLNHGSGDVLFTESVRNVSAAFDIHNQGGDILVGDETVLFEVGDAGSVEGGDSIALVAAAGSIGTAENPFNLRLVRGQQLPDGSISATPVKVSASAGQDVYLDVVGVNNTFEVFDPSDRVDGIQFDIAAQGNVGVVISASEVLDIDLVTHTGHTHTHGGAEHAHAVEGTYDFRSVSAQTGSVALAAAAGDLNLGAISAGGAAMLTASGSIFDADGDFASDVTALHIVLNAGVSIGTEGDALEVDSALVTATAPHDIHLSAVAGDLRLAQVTSAAGSVRLAAAGAIIDAHDDAESDVAGAAVTLAAGTGVGSAGNALEIDSGAGLVSALAQQGVYLRETAGDLRVGRVASAIGDVRLEAAGSILDGEDDPGSDIEAASVLLDAGGSIGANGNAVEVDSAIAGVGLVSASALQGIYLAETAGSLILGRVAAGAEVRLSAAGAIRDDDDSGSVDVVASSAVLSAGSGIGEAGNALETELGALEAHAGGGDLWIVNSGALEVGNVTGDGEANIIALSPLTVSGAILGASVYLEAADTPAAGDDLTVQAGATITATAGPVTLVAGDDLVIEAGSVVASPGEVVLDAGGNLQLAGTVLAESMEITGDDGDNVITITQLATDTLIQTQGGNDIVRVGSNATLTSNAGGNLNAIAALLTLDGGSTGGFDTLHIDDTGDTGANSGTLTAGTLTEFGMAGAIAYTNFEALEIALGSGGNEVEIEGTMQDGATMVNSGAGSDQVTVSLDRELDGALALHLQAGDDFLDASTSSLGLALFGEGGDDTIAGGSGDDLIFGGAGSDALHGNGGDDIIVGDLGAMAFSAANLPAEVWTTSPETGGDDDISGGEGADVILGGSGADNIDAGGGADRVIGDNGRVTFGGIASFDAGEEHAILSFNFNGKAKDAAVTGVAGALPAGNWNNLKGDGPHTHGNDAGELLYFDDGKIAPGITIEWGADLDTTHPGDPDDLHEESHSQIDIGSGSTQDQRLFEGYLSSSTNDTVGVNIAGLSAHFHTYDVYVYLDLDDRDSRSGSSVRSITDGTTPFYLDDPDGNTFTGTYVEVTSEDPNAPQVGNYVVFRGLTSDSVKLRIDDVGSSSNNKPGITAVQVSGTHHAVDRIETIHTGYGGADRITTGSGADIVFGGEMGDTIITHGDSIYGELDADIVAGDNARATFALDELREIATTDEAAGTPGELGDSIYTGSGEDVVIGGDGDDLLMGGDGDDLLLGDNARVMLFGGEVVDLRAALAGDRDDDDRRGESFDPYAVPGIQLLSADIGGDDTIEGGKGDDLIYGQFGKDTFVFVGGRLGDDYLVEAGGGSGLNDLHDRLDFSRFVGPLNIELDDSGRQTVNRHKGEANLRLTLSGGDAFEDVIGSDYSDRIDGNSRNNVLIGLSGNDYIEGADGDDVLLGNGGNDRLKGGRGNDLLDGGDGDDELKGGSGNDILDGGGGNDRLEGGSGDDILLGGDGSDELDGGSGKDVLTGGAGASIDWEAYGVNGWDTRFSPFAAAKPAGGFSNFSDVLWKLVQLDRTADDADD